MYTDFNWCTLIDRNTCDSDFIKSWLLCNMHFNFSCPQSVWNAKYFIRLKLIKWDLTWDDPNEFCSQGYQTWQYPDGCEWTYSVSGFWFLSEADGRWNGKLGFFKNKLS